MKTRANQNASRRDGADFEVVRHYHFVCGCAAQATGQYRSAFAHYRLETRATGYFKAYHNLGGLLLMRRRFREATDSFRAAARAALRSGKRHDAVDSLTSLGVAHSRRGEIAKAKSAWRRAARLDPAEVRSLVNLGLQQLLEGDRHGGDSLLERALRRRPRDPAVRRWVGYAWVKYDLNLRRGLRFLEEARASNSHDASLLADLSLAYQKLGRRDEAMKAIRRAARLDAANADVKAQANRLRHRETSAKRSDRSADPRGASRHA